MRQTHRRAPLDSDLSPCPLHREARSVGPGAGEGERPTAGIPGMKGVEMRPMMSWMLRRAWGKVAAGGGAARIMSPLPSAPRPPGPHALVRISRRCRRDFSHRRDPPGHLLGMACDWGLYLLALRGVGANTRPPPPPPTPVWEARVCARVWSGCVCGDAISPLSPETRDLSGPGSRGSAPSPFVAKRR